MFKHYVTSYKGEIVYIFSSLVTPVISILGSIVASIFIDPYNMGIIFNSLLIGTYASFLQLGVFNGLNRNIAYYKAKQNFETMQVMVNTSHTVALIVSFIGVIIGICYGLYVKNQGIVYIWSAVLLVCNLIFTPLSTHYETTYRSGQEFQRLAMIKFKENIIYSAVVFLPALIGYLGKILSDSAKLMVGYILRSKDVPIKSNGIGSLSGYKELVFSGFPMLLSGYIWSIFQVADQTYISSHFGIEELGLYTLSRYCVMAFMILPQAINSVLYPKASAKFGTTGDPKDLKAFWEKSIMLYSFILIPLVLLLYFIAPLIIPYIMPKYVGGIECMKINLISCISFIYMGPSVIFGTLRKNKAFVILITACLGIFWLGTLMFASLFTTPESIALFRLILSFILSFGTIILSRIYIS